MSRATSSSKPWKPLVTSLSARLAVIRLTTQANGPHQITVPHHKPVRVGTLAAIVSDLAAHHKTSRESVVEKLFK